LKYEALSYARADRVATITLNRPERLNAIVKPMPDEIRAAVERANQDDLVHVILLQGAGRAFCAGYDLKNSAVKPRGSTGSQDLPLGCLPRLRHDGPQYAMLSVSLAKLQADRLQGARLCRCRRQRHRAFL
jgi:enoyl-CoA hydratase/carnithine racemase